MIRIRSIVSLTFGLLFSSMALAQTTANDRQFLAMGTRLSIQLQSDDSDRSARASEAALMECNRIEAACSTWRPDSAWSCLNSAKGESVVLGPEWIALLAKAQGWSRRTGDAFDPVLFRLLAAYGVRDGGRVPSVSELTCARAASGFRNLHLDSNKGLAYLKKGAGIEEGGFVKGYALDRMKARITDQGVASGCLDFGGQLLAFGESSTVFIADARDRNTPRFSIQLKDASLASSGLSEHGHHIVDPRSGRLCEDWGSVSVIASTGLDADCLSTALYVMGPRQGLAWVKRHRVAALFLLNDGSVRMSPAFSDLHPKSISQERP